MDIHPQKYTNMDCSRPPAALEQKIITSHPLSASKATAADSTNECERHFPGGVCALHSTQNMGDREGTAQAGLGTLGSPQTLLEAAAVPPAQAGHISTDRLRFVCPAAPFPAGQVPQCPPGPAQPSLSPFAPFSPSLLPSLLSSPPELPQPKGRGGCFL